MKAALLLALLLLGCDRAEAPDQTVSPGAKLEAAAVRAGLVPDPERASLVGYWARGSDRVCIVVGEGGRERIGVLIDYGEGNGCVASGTVRRSGSRLSIDFGRCRVEAQFDGERISFPAEVDGDCARLCAGNATLDAFSVERVSESETEARGLRTPAGRPLCVG